MKSKRLSNIRVLGTYQDIQTNNIITIRQGRKVGYSVDILFYYTKNKQKVYLSDNDFYTLKRYEKIHM